MTEKIIAVGASTGGTAAIRVFLEGFDASAPAMAIVQHMPAGFTTRFAERLDKVSRVRVKEAENDEPLRQGHVLIAPGDRHMVLRRSGALYFVQVLDTPRVNRHRPSIDVLFESAADSAGHNGVGVIMTGMGVDGARGLLKMRKAGAYTIAQDQETSVVYGMAGEAARLGAVMRSLPLSTLGWAIRREALPG